MKQRLMHGYVCAMALLLTAAPVFAQTGKISGKVVDQQTRQALPGVNVIIEGTTQGAATDAEGDYYIINVPPGACQVQATMVGYAVQTQTDVLVQMDRTVVVDFELGTQALQGEEVTISAEREIIRMDVAGSTTTLEGSEITSAPITLVADYLKIQDGVEYSRSGQGKWLSVRGGERDETDVMLDGQSTMNALTATAYMGVSKTAIKEVSIQTGGFNAEYGRVRSGLVNVVTRDGSRQEYSVGLEGKYSSPHLKHFGRNMFDWQNPIYRTRIGTNNFIPGYFNGAGFSATGDPTIMGHRGEVVIDPNSPEYRGYSYTPPTVDENGVETAAGQFFDAADLAYTDAETQQYQMEPVYSYGRYLEWDGMKSIADNGASGRIEATTLYPADVMATWMNEHPGMRYGTQPDYDMDVTLTGPLPGEQMHNKLGEILSTSTFMLSYRTQTSQFVFPSSAKAYRDKNLQAKITSSISPTTKLRLNALYSESFSGNNGGPGIGGQGDAISTSGYFTTDGLNGAQEMVTGVQGGGRLGASLPAGLTDMFNEGDAMVSANYNFQASAKLTHTVSPSTYFELEYLLSRNVYNYNPIWTQDVYGDYSWVFNINGLTNASGEPRTFITNDPNDIFVDGIANIFDPVRRDLLDDKLLGAEYYNSRGVPFSTGGAGTWPYSTQLVESWFDDTFLNNQPTMKGPDRLYLAQGFNGITGEAVPWEDPARRPGSWDLRDPMNIRRIPNLYSPTYGGLMNGQTLPGMTLVGSYFENGGHMTGEGDRGVDGIWDLSHDGRQIMRSDATMSGGKATVVSQMTKHNQIKAGVDFRWWSIYQGLTHCNGGCSFNMNQAANNTTIGNGTEVLRNIRGNINAYNWQQFDDNPFEMSAFLQDKIEVQGLIANLGLRLDVFDPTTKTLDFSDPYRPEFNNAATEPGVDEPDAGPSRFPTVDKVKGRVVFKWSPRLGLSFPVTETSKVYFNYGWFYQRPTFQQYYQFIHWHVTNGTAPLTYPDGNMDWPRTIQMEMGYEQNVKGWFLIHAAGYYKDDDSMLDRFEYTNSGNDTILRSLVNNNWRDVRGMELRVDKNYGLFRARVNYNYMLRTRGQSGSSNHFEDNLLESANQLNTVRVISDTRPEPQPAVRATAGFYTPRSWGPKIGEKVYPLDNIVVNMIYQWRSKGDRLLFEDPVRPDKNIYVGQVAFSNTDLRAQKDIALGRTMRLGVFVQVFNLWNQKLLVGPNGNNAILQENQAQYNSQFRYDSKYGSSVPKGNDKWGEYNADHLRETLPWYFDFGLFEDKRDVFYGITFTYN